MRAAGRVEAAGERKRAPHVLLVHPHVERPVAQQQPVGEPEGLIIEGARVAVGYRTEARLFSGRELGRSKRVRERHRRFVAAKSAARTATEFFDMNSRFHEKRP